MWKALRTRLSRPLELTELLYVKIWWSDFNLAKEFFLLNMPTSRHSRRWNL
jgi:hypothetical protein